MSHSMGLPALGWDEWFQSKFEQLEEAGVIPGRVAVLSRGAYLVYHETGEAWAELAGRLRHRVDDRSELPAVGDWVALSHARTDSTALVVAVLPRRTKISRKAPGDRDRRPDRYWRVEEQVLAANLDLMLVVSAVTEEFKVSRIERYITMAWQGGAHPVVVLNKADLADPEDARAGVERSCPGVEVCITSAVTGTGLDHLRRFTGKGRTLALVGSSGVGKTALVNSLTGNDLRRVQATRADGRGRHTTTRRELIPLPEGGFIIDTPGLRELALWNADLEIERVFDEVAELAGRCRFRDCTHTHEPDCAVRTALEEGGLDPRRYANYQKLQREQRYLEAKQAQLRRRRG